MKKNSSKKRTLNTAKSSGTDKLFTVIIALLSVVLVVLSIITAVKINESHQDYITTPNDILRTVKNGYYPDALEEMHDNIALGETETKNPEYALPYALSDYYEAQSLYTAYSKAAKLTEDAEKANELDAAAARYQQEMESARKRTGELEFMTQDIDSVFE